LPAVSIDHQSRVSREVYEFQELEKPIGGTFGTGFAFFEISLNQQLPLVRSEACTQELELSRGLIEKLSSESFEPESYRDENRDRVLAMIDEKVKGQEITVPPNASVPRRVIDLMAALKESTRTAQRGKKRTEERKRKKANRRLLYDSSSPNNRQLTRRTK
jgi:hypothetical protein